MADPLTTQFTVQLTSNFGYVGTWEAAKALKETFELQKASRFTALRTSTSFGKTDNFKQKKKCLWAEGNDYVSGEAIPFDGIPFIVLGKNIYECQYGSDHKVKRKTRREEQNKNEEDESETGSKRKSGVGIEKCKKFNCPAKIRMKEILKFPDFQIERDNRYKRNKGATKLNAAIERGEVKGERRIYIYFPSDNEHSGHRLRSQVCATRQHVDGRIINLIDQLMEESATMTVDTISQKINDFVKETSCNGSSTQEKSTPRHSPDEGDIRYHMEAARIIHTYSKLQPEELEEHVTQMRAEHADHNIFFRKTTEEEELLFVHQTHDQLQMMLRFQKEMYFLDSTCKTTQHALPLLLISVQASGDQQIVASAILEKGTEGQMRDALEVIRSWHPAWKPASVMTEFEDIDAVKESFERVPVRLCDYHRTSDWTKWIHNPANNVKEGERAALEATLEMLSNARTREEYCQLLMRLYGSDACKEDQFRSWFGSKWLLHYEKWVKAFLPVAQKSLRKTSSTCTPPSGTCLALTYRLRDQCFWSLQRLTELAQKASEEETLDVLLKCLGRAEQMYGAYISRGREDVDEDGAQKPKRRRRAAKPIVDDSEPIILEDIGENVEILYQNQIVDKAISS